MKTEVKFQWKKGSRVSVSASETHRFLEDCREIDDGDLRMETVVTRSKPRGAVLHNEFEWNDKKAAHAHRMNQARYIVRSIEVVQADIAPYREYESVQVVTESDDDAKPVTSSVFRRTEDILRDPEARTELLLAAIRDANAYKRKYAALSELSMVFHAIDEVAKEVSA